MPKFGVSLYSIVRQMYTEKWTAGQCVTWLAEQGAEVIELVPFGLDMVANPELIDEVLNAAKEAGVPIENYSLNANFLLLNEEEYAAEVARVKSHIDVAGKLGVPTMRIDCSAFNRPFEKNTTEYFVKELPTIVDTYNLLCDYAAQYNLIILLESHGFHVNGAERTAQILEAMKGKNFAAQVDCGNYVCVDDPAEIAVKKNIKYAKTVHMKDFYIRPANRNPGHAPEMRRGGGWFRSVCGKYIRGSILGQGDLDIHDIIATIKNSGFDGNIFIEFEGMEDCLYGTKVSLDNLKRIWNEV